MEKSTKAAKSNRSALLTVVAILGLLAGLALLLYPTVADYVNSLGFRSSISDYRQQISRLDDDTRRQLWQEALAYNEALAQRTTRMELLSPDQRIAYNSVLDATGNGMMGYLVIEKIHVDLPIFHGTEEDALHSGVGHLEGSSLPVGGETCHALLSGHSGLPSAKLLSNMDQLELGDTFELHVLGYTLVYRVDSIQTVLPEEAEKLRIEKGKDYCTLMTCTPYGVNTHRLLVRGVRVEQEASPTAAVASTQPLPAPEPDVPGPVLWIAVAAVAVVAVGIAVGILCCRKGGKRKP